jgi:hypothetical protein
MPIRRLGPKFGRARQRAAAEQGGGAQAGAECKQGPSRNMLCHAFPPLFFMKMFVCARTNPSAAGSNGPRYAAPAFESWQAELASWKACDRTATAAYRNAKRTSLGAQLEMQSMESGRIRCDCEERHTN